MITENGKWILKSRHYEQVTRHCERSEAIQCGGLLLWVASGYALAMTAFSLFNSPLSIRAPRVLAFLGNLGV
ncbi:MAG: hypothetical protein LBT00_10415 [Spirochaetaceae bacterium]|nr:hypothetical protein [Spirochaetaceae bacterium]